MQVDPDSISKLRRNQVGDALRKLGWEEVQTQIPPLIAGFQQEHTNRSFVDADESKQVQTIEDYLMRMGVGDLNDPVLRDHLRTNVIPRMIPTFRAAILENPALFDGQSFTQAFIQGVRPDLFEEPATPQFANEGGIIEGTGGPIPEPGALEEFERANDERALQLIDSGVRSAALPLSGNELANSGTALSRGQTTSPQVAEALAVRGVLPPGFGARVGQATPNLRVMTPEELIRFTANQSGDDPLFQRYLLQQLSSPEFIRRLQTQAGSIRRERESLRDLRQEQRSGEGLRQPLTTLSTQDRVNLQRAFPIRSVDMAELLTSDRISGLREEFDFTPQAVERRQAEEARSLREQEVEDTRLQREADVETARVEREQEDIFQRKLRSPRVRVT